MVLKQISSAGNHSIYVCTSVVLCYLLTTPQLLSWTDSLLPGDLRLGLLNLMSVPWNRLCLDNTGKVHKDSENHFHR